MLGDEGYPDAGVGLYDVEHHLSANVFEQVLNVVSDEGVIIDGAPANAKFRSQDCSNADSDRLIGHTGCDRQSMQHQLKAND